MIPVLSSDALGVVISGKQVVYHIFCFDGNTEGHEFVVQDRTEGRCVRLDFDTPSHSWVLLWEKLLPGRWKPEIANPPSCLPGRGPKDRAIPFSTFFQCPCVGLVAFDFLGPGR